jgi:hypothetical protein
MHLSRFGVLLLLSVTAGWPAPSALAQERPNPPARENTLLLPEPPNQPFPSTFHPSFQWNYVCPRENAAGCSLACPPNAVISSVAAAQVWLGTSDLGNVSAQAIYYYLTYFNGREKMAGAGLIHSTRYLSCQVLALKVSYSGPPK